MSPFDILGAVAGVAAVAFMYGRVVRPTTTPPTLTDPPPPVTMFVLDGAGDHHGRWVELPAGTECACGSSEHITLRGTNCGHAATLHHCHHGDRP